MLFHQLAAAVALAGSPPGGPQAIPDSSEILARARSVQESFERRRQRLLPTTWSSRGRCEERIGRFCYWYDDRDTTLPPEPPLVPPARARLLAELDSLHTALPGDEWILGQRVRYLVEHGDAEAAVVLTGGCAPDRWWCQALAGFALHALGRFPAAGLAFDRALATMPPEVRCDWTDWSPVLDGDLYDRFRRLPCESRTALADSIFWLATPLLSRPGNDLRSEMLSRRVIDWFLRGSRSPQAMTWGRDVTELILRYGWPVRWSTAEPSHPAALEPSSVVGHEPTPAFSFFPEPADDPEAWRFDPRRERPRSRYAPGYARGFDAIERHQIARFPRADSTVIVLAADLRADTAFARPFDLAGVASAGVGAEPSVARRPGAGGEGVVVVRIRAPDGPLLVGIEAEAAGGHFARARTLLDPVASAQGVKLSDLLLFRAGESLPGTLEEAARRALPSARWPRDEPVGVYWELSGRGADSLAVAVSVVPERRGLLGRIGQSLSLVKGRAPMTLGWRIETDQGPTVGRVFELDLDELGAGTYTMFLTIATPDGVEHTTQRRIELLK